MQASSRKFREERLGSCTDTGPSPSAPQKPAVGFHRAGNDLIDYILLVGSIGKIHRFIHPFLTLTFLPFKNPIVLVTEPSCPDLPTHLFTGSP